LPDDLLADVETPDLVSRLPIVRTGGPIDPDVIVVGAQVATTLVTFAQVPQTIDYLSAALRRWRRGSRADTVTLEVRGPRGRVRLDLAPDTDPADIARVLRLLDAPDDDDDDD
jgi:hypothetical protein